MSTQLQLGPRGPASVAFSSYSAKLQNITPHWAASRGRSGPGLRASVVPGAGSVAPGPSSGGVPSSVASSSKPHHTPSVTCHAVTVLEREAAVAATAVAPVATPIGPAEPAASSPPGPEQQQVPSTTLDVAVIGADVAGLAAALAASRAYPGARVTLYDTAREPPHACDGGVLLAVNGLRALQALDPQLYSRITTQLGTRVHESLWFSTQCEMLRRNVLGKPTPGAPLAGGSRRRAAAQRRAAAAASSPSSAQSAAPAPDPSAAPLMVGLHELREALTDALPPEVEIHGGHHLVGLERVAPGAGPSGGGGCVLRFAASAGGPPVRAVRARLVIGADGVASAVKRLQLDTAAEPQPSGRVVWSGRLTLRQRDPDPALLRNFTTASRVWMDLRAQQGCERVATLTPAGPNTFVWTASCPAQMLASRGLAAVQEPGVSAYWRCVAMFEDFPQEFFGALRASVASAVVERQEALAAPAGVAAPWQWFSGPVGLVGPAVHGLPLSSDDGASSGAGSPLNLALEDAAVLGATLAAHGFSSRALLEYAHARGPRVSSLLGLPPTSPERARLRSAPFLPTPPVTATMITAPAAAPSAPTAEGEAAPATPTPTLAAATTEEAPTGAPAPAPAPATDTLLLDRPAGGASQLGSLPLTTQDEAAQLAEVGTSSPLSKAPAAALTAASAPTSPDASDSSSTTSNSVMPVASPVATPAPVPSYSVAATPRAVWQQLLAAASLDDLLGPGPSADAAVTTSASGSAARWQYCAVETPSGVWQALLPSASTAAASPSPVPFDAAATPQRVWAALLSRSSAATPPAFPPPSPSPKPSPAAASAAAEADNGLLPRPTPRRRDRDPQRSRTPSPPSSNSSNTSPTAAAPSDAPTAGPTAGAANPSPPASPEKPTGRRGGAKGGGKGSKGHRHAKGGGRKEQRSGGARAGVRAVAQLAAKGASATMSTVTASLGAAAAIGTVLGGASGGHMVDPHTALAVGHGAAAALGHVGGVAPSVAAFWEDLNTLTMASASLSSMDV